jgi:tryptophan-rich sensory protein
MNDFNKSDLKGWVRLTVIVGVTCAVIASILVMFLFLAWHANGYYGRLFDKVFALDLVVMLLITLFCGIILRKRRPTIGKVLLGLALLLIIAVLLSPEL